ncbi:tetratricopeptide repeat protein [Richelia sinica FACHB-800]|nr:tetratricopeptide repeat protein [Richelia sinica FACHB-800]
MYWHGRENEVAKIQNWLNLPNIKLIGVTAAGGFGKSTLVGKIFDNLQNFDHKIWTSFSQAYPFGIWGRWVLEQLKQPAPERDEELLIALCNCLQKGRYLLVWDNLETLLTDNGQWQDAAYGEFLLRWFGSNSPSVILVTSREKPTLPNNTLSYSKWLDLPGLATDAGVALLRNLQVEGSDLDLQNFVQRVNGHPLLIKLVAGLLLDEQEELKELKQNLFAILGLHRDDPEASIGKILDASIKRLSPKLQTLLLNVSVYRLAFDESAAAALINEQITTAELRQLAKRSLLQEKKQEGVWKFQFQPLIQSYLQQRPEDRTQAHELAIAYYTQRRKLQLEPDDNLQAVTEYLEIFHHYCELGQYAEAFSSVFYAENNHDDCDEFLRKRYYNAVRLTLYERLITEWQSPKENEKRFFSDALKVYGDVLQFLDRRDEALSHYEQALSFYREIGARLGEANTLKAIGDVLQFLDRRDEALSRYEQALSFYREIGARLGEANTLKAIGDVLQFLKRSNEALSRYEQALSFYRDTGSRLGEANTLKAIGDVLQFLDRRDEALSRYEQALSFYREIGDRLGEANTLKAIGDVLQFLKRSNEALSRYEQALSFYRDTGSRLGEANTLKAIGDVLQFLDRRDEALSRYEQALSFYREIGDRLGEANTLQAIGDVLQFLDRRDEALSRYEQALSFYRDTGSRLGEANVLQEFGKLEDDPKQSLVFLQQAHNIYQQIGDIYSQSRNLLFIANVQLQLADKAAAINSLITSEELAAKINYQPLQEYAQNKLAEIQGDEHQSD